MGKTKKWQRLSELPAGALFVTKKDKRYVKSAEWADGDISVISLADGVVRFFKPTRKVRPLVAVDPTYLADLIASDGQTEPVQTDIPIPREGSPTSMLHDGLIVICEPKE